MKHQLSKAEKERKVPLGTLQAILGFSEAQEHDALVCKAKVRATFACNTERMRESVSVIGVGAS